MQDIFEVLMLFYQEMDALSLIAGFILLAFAIIFCVVIANVLCFGNPEILSKQNFVISITLTVVVSFLVAYIDGKQIAHKLITTAIEEATVNITCSWTPESYIRGGSDGVTDCGKGIQKQVFYQGIIPKRDIPYHVMCDIHLDEILNCDRGLKI